MFSAVNLRARIALILIIGFAFGLAKLPPSSHAQSWQTDPRLSYEKNLEDRIKDHEDNSKEYRKFNNDRYDDLNTLARSTAKKQEESDKKLQRVIGMMDGVAKLFEFFKDLIIPGLIAAGSFSIAIWKWIWPLFFAERWARRWKKITVWWCGICGAPGDVAKLHSCVEGFKQSVTDDMATLRQDLRHDVRGLLTPMALEIGEMKERMKAIEGDRVLALTARVEITDVAQSGGRNVKLPDLRP